MYPGTQSILIPAAGIAHEWITSRDEAMICSLVSIGMATAPVACSRTILLIPFFIGRYCDFRSLTSLEVSLALLANFGERTIEFRAHACIRLTLLVGRKFESHL